MTALQLGAYELTYTGDDGRRLVLPLESIRSFRDPGGPCVEVSIDEAQADLSGAILAPDERDLVADCIADELGRRQVAFDILLYGKTPSGQPTMTGLLRGRSAFRLVNVRGNHFRYLEPDRVLDFDVTVVGPKLIADREELRAWTRPANVPLTDDERARVLSRIKDTEGIEVTMMDASQGD